VPRAVTVFGGRTEDWAVKMLGQAPILSSLSARQLRSLARQGKERSYSAGSKVVQRGEGGIGLFLMLDGKAEVRRGGRTLAKLGPGQFFGEMSLLDDQPRSADVVASEPCRCLVLSKWEFWGFAENQPKVLRGILQEMARRLRETDQSLSE
jgi:CRP/FNR family transcriptional regulator, cyclic AMP receptor protein